MRQHELLQPIANGESSSVAFEADDVRPKILAREIVARCARQLSRQARWHNEPSAEFDGLKLGEYFEGYVDSQCAELGLTRDALRAWRPGAKVRKAGAGQKNGTKVSTTG